MALEVQELAASDDAYFENEEGQFVTWPITISWDGFVMPIQIQVRAHLLHLFEVLDPTLLYFPLTLLVVISFIHPFVDDVHKHVD